MDTSTLAIARPVPAVGAVHGAPLCTGLGQPCASVGVSSFPEIQRTRMVPPDGCVLSHVPFLSTSAAVDVYAADGYQHFAAASKSVQPTQGARGAAVGDAICSAMPRVVVRDAVYSAAYDATLLE